ncbi:MAG: carbon-nitrogen hydrolase family protein [Anaerolineae bacterium]|nr:carbon-nitrogen hydrolase family protein [Anaerolineae bacterium]
MRVALVINAVTCNQKDNLSAIMSMTQKAADGGADLILFPEAALTGLINNDDPTHDLPLGESLPGPVTDALARLCSDNNVWLGIGLLERDHQCLFDTAVLLDSKGSIAIKYRRIQPQWHGVHANPLIYKEGTVIPTVVSPFGTLGFLICGDLFDDEIISEFKKLHADWLLFPFARSFNDGSFDQDRWDTEELPVYADRVKRSNTTALMVNLLADPELHDGNSFGGAWVISSQGEVIASYPLGKSGILWVDFQI